MGQYRLVTGSYWDRKHSYISRRIVKEYDFSRETKDYKTTKLTWGEQTKREELKSQIRLFRIVKDEDILQDIVIGRHYVEPDKPGSEDDDHDESEGIEQEQSEEDEEEEDAETETESEDDDEDDEGGDRAFHGSEGLKTVDMRLILTLRSIVQGINGQYRSRHKTGKQVRSLVLMPM